MKDNILHKVCRKVRDQVVISIRVRDQVRSQVMWHVEDMVWDINYMVYLEIKNEI